MIIFLTSQTQIGKHSRMPLLYNKYSGSWLTTDLQCDSLNSVYNTLYMRSVIYLPSSNLVAIVCLSRNSPLRKIALKEQRSNKISASYHFTHFCRCVVDGEAVILTVVQVITEVQLLLFARVCAASSRTPGVRLGAVIQGSWVEQSKDPWYWETTQKITTYAMLLCSAILNVLSV